MTALQGQSGSTTNVSDGGARDSVGQYTGLRVLVVDDDMMTRMLMTRMLARLGCTVQTAENGQAALDLIFAPLATPSTATTGSASDGPLMMGGGRGSAPGTPVTEDVVQSARFHIVFLDNQMVRVLAARR